MIYNTQMESQSAKIIDGKAKELCLVSYNP